MNVKLMAKQAQLQDIVDKVGGVGGRGGRGEGETLAVLWQQFDLHLGSTCPRAHEGVV